MTDYTYKIPFNRPCFIGRELEYIKQAVENGKISGNGEFTKRCNRFIENKFGIKKCLLTTSCTDALEMSAILIDVEPGDEIILPSYTFVSTVNAFVLRGATPMFIDIREDTLNIDENKIEERITEKTKAIVVVHYGGIGCEMDKILEIARRYNLYLIEDAAQGINAKYKDRYLGRIGDIGAYSFHETKNYISGEGGAILINREDFIERAEILLEKGTNRKKFFRGEVDRYTWVDIGSSYLPSDIIAAFLYAQLEHLDHIQKKRKEIFNYYCDNLKELEDRGILRLPVIPENCSINYHLFYILLKDMRTRSSLIEHFKRKGILTVFHYIPLHLSPMGKRFGYREGDFPITEDLSCRLLRLPFYNELKIEELKHIVETLKIFF